MKKIFTLTALAIASLLIATRSDAQVYVNAQVGYPAGYGVAYADEFPGYAYYNYPAWNGHYRDYYYYAHYRPFFERRYGYGGFANRGYVNRGNFNRGYGGQAYAGRGGFGQRGGYSEHGGFGNRGGFGNHGGGFANHGGGGYGHGRR